MEPREIGLFLDTVQQRYGYDFHHYAKPSMERRIENCIIRERLSSISELTLKILDDAMTFDRFLLEMSVTVTRMFRNPEVFRILTEQVLPELKSYSQLKIWHAGCATGEEVYSLAILLAEAGLLERTKIYATDYNSLSLEIAEKAIYSLDGMQETSRNYLAAGGLHSFSDYYQARYGLLKIADFLKQRVIFSYHNLMQDKAFTEMNIILCRNVIIYFDKVLQDQVLTMMSSSLCSQGFLVLGDRETVNFTSVSGLFTEIARPSGIFLKRDRPPL